MEFSKREKTILIIFVVLISFIIMGKSLMSSFNKPQITIENDEMSQTEEKESEVIEEADAEIKEIAVDVVGEVTEPGLVILKEGARVIDAIGAAGGMLESADRRLVNLARILKDEEQIYVPKIGENVSTEGYNNDRTGEGGQLSKKLNINHATAAELESLNGIGEALSSRIIQYRSEKGNFKDIKDIMKVSGIGEKKFDGFKDQITVK